MTALNKQALRDRYSPQPVPKCHICGAEMTIGAMSASRIVYACSGATYDDAGCHYAPGRSIADEHYAQSRVTVHDVGDPDVIALLDELEARTVTLPDIEKWRSVDAVRAQNAYKVLVSKVLTAAGIGVKGE